ncbi:RNA-binding E3 ubiquitin-protein ligase MEX3C [Pyrus ussuriensis x Pyrus communis]|uniref:RNA-binding E3 ubiquitin-protein ligase MEX3C n=1 Tax=Pyrus ussuriensis x Pyrus communis TaxID=2448454 RepID=A0A5N5F3I6_9ROSA|nr:RNA-binding E3 ubiquitin-protein ligase MEX3C [Pyrus ussuriensis x Pyrus communis]
MQVGDCDDDCDGFGEGNSGPTIDIVEEQMRDCFIKNKRPKRRLSPSAATLAEERRLNGDGFVGSVKGFDPQGSKERALELVYEFHGLKGFLPLPIEEDILVSGKGSEISNASQNVNATYVFHVVNDAYNNLIQSYVAADFRQIGNPLGDLDIGLFSIIYGLLGHDVLAYLQSNLFENTIADPEFWTWASRCWWRPMLGVLGPLSVVKMDTQAKAFHCAVSSKMSGLAVMGYRVLASGHSNGAFKPLERKWQQQQWGRKKDYSCFCDHFCPSKLWGLAFAPLTVETLRFLCLQSSPANHRPLVAVLSLHADLLMRNSKELVAVWKTTSPSRFRMIKMYVWLRQPCFTVV